MHEGNGTMQLAFEERATDAQRAALRAIVFGEHGGMPFEIFAELFPHRPEPVVAPITFEADREERTAAVVIPGLGESHIEPIKNPVTGEPHRARIVLPDGIEFQEAEMGNSTRFSATGAGPLAFEHENTYAQLNAFDWTNVS